MPLDLITPPEREPVSIYEQLVHSRISLDQAIKDVKHNLHGSANPGAGDDSADGYAAGSLWRNEVSDNWFKATDVTEGTAVWESYAISAHDKEQLADVEEAISAARQHAEDFTNRAFITQTWELRMDGFYGRSVTLRRAQGERLSCEIVLPKPRLQEVVSVKYVDPFGTERTFTDWEAKFNDYSAVVKPKDGFSWPATKVVYDAVKIRFTSGYGVAPEDVPANIRRGIKMIASELYDNRGESITGATVNQVIMSAEMLMWPCRVINF